ncbi:MAG: filamentous hemagglutinin N-terminal domain-containing protein, partial [Candidatus Omnitrophica bacterium]|nr:filamentous hemagglutinin N-terminal domain-containing protein [Candidatus Omnitrophota bacterium]
MKKIWSIWMLVLIFVNAAALPVYALPEGEHVEAGNARFEHPDPATLNIHVDDKTIINFTSFNIASNEVVNFIQPTCNASVLSRVTGPDPSIIAGGLTANGILVLINPNGLTFTPTANVQVNTLVASTLDISNNNFINGNYELIRNQNSNYAQVLNEGRIVGSNIALIGSSVENRCIIIARAGTVHLAGGDKVVVSFDRRGLINVAITEATSGRVIDKDGNTVKDAVSNTGTIEAHQVFMTARTAADIFENAVNQAGIIKASAIAQENGIIRISADKNIKISGSVKFEGVYGTSRIMVTSDGSVNVTGEFNTKGDTEISAGKDINIDANIKTESGDLDLIADADRDGIGAVKQAKGTRISTVDRGDVTVQSSGEGTLANIYSSGDLILRHGGAPAAFTQAPDSRIVTKGSMQIGEDVTLRANNAV